MATKEKKFNPMRMPAKKVAKNNEDQDQEDYNQKAMKQQRGKGQNMDGLQGMPEQKDIEFSGKTDKQSLAMELLKEGYIQSYIDFFYITKPGLKPEDGGVSDYLTTDKLVHLKDQLSEAEEHTKYIYPVKIPAIEGYYNLAEKFFNEYNQFLDAAYFYKRVIQIAKHSEEDQWVGRGNLGYGKCYDRCGDIGKAIEILERSLHSAEEKGNNQQIIDQISQELIKIYHKLAQEYEKGEADNISNALTYYEKCLEVAQKCGSNEDEGNISYKIGLLYFKIGKYQKGIDFQSKYLKIAQNIAGEEGKMKQMEAYSALAKCYLKLNMTEEALEQLNLYYEFADKLRIPNAVSDAALHLATLWAQKGNTKKSLEMYKTHFDGARTAKPEVKDRKIVDKARVTYGIAQANAYIDQHIERVKNSDKNLKALLDWKSNTKKQ